MRIVQGREEEYKKYVQKNSQDGYSRCVVDFSEEWANLMEEEMTKETESIVLLDWIKTNADRLCYEPSRKHGLTGFQYGCAMQALAYFWEHGEALRRWHNIKFQIRDEGEKANQSGGVLNPAILNVK